MLHAPKWTEIPKYPVITGVAILAGGATLAWWANLDVSFAFESAEIRRGQVWRLLTSILPHVDILHFAFNMYWLWVFGTLIERVYGPAKSAGLILLFALGSNSLDFAFMDGAVGLSGVGYGLFGFLWILSHHDERFREAVDRNTVSVFVGWFFLCIATTVTNIMPVANVAHAAGAIFGVLVGAAIIFSRYRLPALAGISALLLLGIWGATFGRPLVNLSGRAGFEEGQWGYEALLAHRNEEAARWLRDAATLQPRIPQYWFNLGIAYDRLGNRTDAIEAYQRAHELEPNNPAYVMPKLE